MHVVFSVSPASGDETLLTRLAAVTEKSATLGSLRCGRPELELATAWQLALALGGAPRIESGPDRKLRVQISLPLTTAGSHGCENAVGPSSEIYLPALNNFAGNGH